MRRIIRVVSGLIVDHAIRRHKLATGSRYHDDLLCLCHGGLRGKLLLRESREEWWLAVLGRLVRGALAPPAVSVRAVGWRLGGGLSA